MNNSQPNNNRNSSAAIRTAIIFGACVLGIIILTQIQPIKNVLSWFLDMLFPVFLGVVLAYIVSPFTTLMENWFYRIFKLKKEVSRKKFARGLSVTLSVVALILVIVLLIFLIIPEFLQSLKKLIDSAPSFYDTAVDWFEDIQESDSVVLHNIGEYANSALDTAFKWISGELGSAVSRVIESVILVVSFLVDFLVALVVFVYALLEKHKFIAQSKKLLFAIFKPNRANDILHILRYSNEVFGKFILGKLITSSVVGVLTFLFMSIMGMPYALLSAGIIAITNVIPFFGPFIGGIPTGLIVLLSDWQQGIIYAVFLLVLQQIEGNIIEPMVMADQTGLSKFWIVFSILLCGGLFGIAGMLFAVPVFAVMFYAIKLAVDRSLTKKNLPTTASAYSKAGGIDPSTNQLLPIPQRTPHKKFSTALNEWRAKLRKKGSDDNEDNKD